MTPAERQDWFIDFRHRLFAEHDLTAVDDCVHPEFRSHSPLIKPGRDGYRAFMQALHLGLPDLCPLSREALADGDRLMAMYRWEATHAGPFLGIAATGKTLRFATADLYRLRDGLLFEHADIVDARDTWVALGLLVPTRPNPLEQGAVS